jgi:hypothetical protein
MNQLVNLFKKCTMANERESQKSRELVADHKIDIERDLIKFRLRNELFKHNGKSLSIFQEDTKDTVFMRKIFLKIFHLVRLLTMLIFLIYKLSNT